jgi:hypothetical protein
MAADTTDLRAGWEIYRNAGFQLSLDEINERLEAAGFSKISKRAYDHFRRLERRGFRRYVTINRLDTMSMPDPFSDESIRSRYAYSDANVPTQLVVHMHDQPVEVLGTADSLSDFGTEIVVADNEQASALRESPPPNRTGVSVNFLVPPATAYGFIDFVDTLDPAEVRIGVVFRELTAIQELVGASALETTSFRVVIGRDQSSDTTLDVVSRDVYWLVQTIESARGIVNLVLEALAGDSLRTTPPSVSRLSVASPLDAYLRFNIAVFLVLDQALQKLGGYADGIRLIAGALVQKPLIEAKAEVATAEAERIRAQTAGIKIENQQKQAVADILTAAANALVPQIRAAGLPVNPNPEINTDRLLGLISELRPGADYLADRGAEISEGNENGA